MTVTSRLQCISLLVLATASPVALAGIQFTPIYTDAPGIGFNDPTLGAVRKVAFERALSTWSGLLGTKFVGQRLEIDAGFEALGGTAESATLAYAGSEDLYSFNRTTGSNQQILLTHPQSLTGDFFQENIDSSPDITVRFNTDVDGPLVFGAQGFYYGAATNTGGNVDFESVALHELGHGLGFSSSMGSDGSYGVFESSPTVPRPMIYDFFLATGNGDALISMNDAQRNAVIANNNLVWRGLNGILANDGEYPAIYDPNPYRPGSSFSHLDETLFPDAILSPQYSGLMRNVGDIELGMLADMGWTIVPEPAALGMLLLLGLPLARRRRGTTVVAKN